jgi:hypothetical protein
MAMCWCMQITHYLRQAQPNLTSSSC